MPTFASIYRIFGPTFPGRMEKQVRAIEAHLLLIGATVAVGLLTLG